MDSSEPSLLDSARSGRTTQEEQRWSPLQWPRPHTGGKGVITQWVYGESIVSFETIRLVSTHQVWVEYF